MFYTKLELPPRLTGQEVLELLPLVRSGDETARTRMIEGYMRLTAVIATRYIFKYPSKSEALFSEALLALVVAVDRVAKNVGCTTHDNVSAYVHKYIRCELLEFVKCDHLVRPPLNSAWLIEKINEHGRNFLYYEFGCIPYFEDSIGDPDTQESESDGGRRVYQWPSSDIKKQQEFDFSEIELLESDFFTSREKIILRLRLQGQNNKVIGRAIGYTEARVGQMIKEMERRVIKIIKGLV